MLKIITLLTLCVVSLFGQVSGQAVSQITGPPPSSVVSLFFYNGSSQILNICYAGALQPVTTWYHSSATLTNIAVATNVGTITFGATAQLWVGQQIIVAGSATVALNGSYRVNTVSGSTATIATSGVGNGTYTDTGLTVATTGPVLNSPIWSIAVFNYSSSNLATSYWAGTPGVSVPQGLACSNRANY